MSATGFLVFIGRIGIFLFFNLRISQVWSLFYRVIWERKLFGTPLKRFAALSDLVAYIRGLKWRADSWRELWDATSSPGAIQHRANTEPKKLIGDCDEFGVYISSVIKNELKEKAD